MLIKLHGKFREDYGPEYRVEASTIEEAIRAFSTQVGFYTDRMIEDRPVARIPEAKTPEDFTQKTELSEIHLVPAMIGGSGVAKIAIGAVLIATALVLPVVGVPLAGWFASALVTVGATLALQGAMQLFMKAPEISIKGSKDPEASKYFGLSENSISIGTPIPIQYGRGPATGHLLAVNIDAKDLVYGQFPVTPT